MANLNLSLLGGFQVRLGTGPALEFGTRKAQALLAVLAVPPGQPHTREKLAALLWGETTDSQAGNNLRQTLFVLRKLLAGAGAALVEQNRALALLPDAIEVDVSAFERLVVEGTPAALKRAAALYRGDFLQGLDVNEAPFEEWLRTERERLREQALDALVKLLAHELNAGDTVHAARTAGKILALDPVQEAVHRTLMRIYARQGRRTAALRQYELCVTFLQRELGAEPEAETKQLYRELLTQAPLESVKREASRMAPGPDSTGETFLVGRDSNLNWFREALADVRNGSGRVAAVVGETGIGKSSLLAAVAADAGRRGTHLLLGHSYTTEQALAFGPWLDAFRSAHVAADAEVLETLAPVWRAELARLLPEVGTAGREPTSAGDALRLFESVRQLLLSLANREPVVLMLEDLHWADEASIRLLAFLVHRIKTARVLLVFTAREEELSVAPLLKQVIDDLAREPHAALVALSPLERPDTAALVRTLVRTGSDETSVAKLEERVWSLSQGNPFVVVEMMRAFSADATSSLVGTLPNRVREVIMARLDHLSGSARHLLGIAAVIGRQSNFAVLRRAGGFSDEETAGAIEELVRRRVLRDVGDRFDFLHDRIREVAYSQLLPPRLKIMHEQIAEAIETLHAEHLEEVCDSLAHHYAEAGIAAKAVEYLTRAADRAAHAYAYEDAVVTFRRALVHASRLPADVRDQRLMDVILRLAHALYFLGRYPEALEILLEHQERVERLGNPATAGSYHFLIGRYCSLLGDRRATAHARRAIEEATRCGDPATVGRANFLLSYEFFWLSRFREGVEHGREAIRLLEESNEQWWAANASWMMGMNCTHLGEFEAALAAQAHTDAIGRLIGDDHLVNCAAWAKGLTLATLGDWASGVSLCQEAIEHSRDHFNTTRATVILGFSRLQQGEAGEAILILKRAADTVAQSGFTRLRVWIMGWLAEAYLLNDDPAQARETALAVVQVGTALDWPFGIAVAQRVLGRVHLRYNEFANAEREFTAALGTFSTIGAAFEAARTQIDLAELARLRSDAGSALDHLREARHMFEVLGLPSFVARTDSLLSALPPKKGRRPS